MLQVDLLFGCDVVGCGFVIDVECVVFFVDMVMLCFFDGFIYWDMYGQWYDCLIDRIMYEDSFVICIIVDDMFDMCVWFVVIWQVYVQWFYQ